MLVRLTTASWAAFLIAPKKLRGVGTGFSTDGRFKFDFTDHRQPPFGDPGFQVKIKGKIKGGKATGTLRVLKDPSLGGPCTSPTGQFKLHRV